MYFCMYFHHFNICASHIFPGWDGGAGKERTFPGQVDAQHGNPLGLGRFISSIYGIRNIFSFVCWTDMQNTDKELIFWGYLRLSTKNPFFWWFGVYNQIWLVVSNIFYFHNIWHVILPIDHCIFNMVKNRRPVLDNGVLMVYNNVHLSMYIYIYWWYTSCLRMV